MIDEKESLATFIALEKKIKGDLKVACLGIVTLIENDLLTCQPILKETYSTGKVEKLPLLTKLSYIGDVPEVGDLALIVFTDKRHNIQGYEYQENTPFDNYLIDGIPKEKRHTLNNGVAITLSKIRFEAKEKEFIKTNFGILKSLIMQNGGVDVEDN